MLASWTFDASEVLLTIKNDDNNDSLCSFDAIAPFETFFTLAAYYIPNKEWRLLDFRARRNNRHYECCEYDFPDISYYFLMKRNPLYYIITLVVPSVFIALVTVVGFFTPYSSDGENTEKVRARIIV